MNNQNSKNSKRAKIIKTILIVAAILALIVFGYFYWRMLADLNSSSPAVTSNTTNQSQKKSTSGTTENNGNTDQTSAETCTVDYTSDEKIMISDWKTFSNTQYHYTVKYPSDWQIANTGTKKWQMVSIVSPEEDITQISNLLMISGDETKNFSPDKMTLSGQTQVKVACQTATLYSYIYDTTAVGGRKSIHLRVAFSKNGTNFLAILNHPDLNSASLNSDYFELFNAFIKTITF